MNPYIIPGLRYKKPILDTKYKLPSISKTVCEYFDIKEEELKSKRRFRELVDARMVFTHLVLAKCNINLSKIGRWLNRDHASVIHYKKEASNQLETNKAFRDIIRKVESRLSY